MILCYGSLGPDLVHRLPRLPSSGDDVRSEEARLCYGGGALNPAVALASWGLPVRVSGHAVGSDPLGRWLLEEAGRLGVDTSLVEADAAATPHCVILLTPDAERTIVSSGYREVAWRPVPDEAWEGARLAVVDGYSGPAGAQVAEEASRRGLPAVGFDVVEAAEACAVVVWSRHEHPDEEEAVALAAGRLLVLTDGPRPVVALAGERRFEVTPPQVRVADPTGAGDLVAAVLAFGLLEGWEPERSVRMAVAAASLLVGRGREEGIPSLEKAAEAAGL